MRGRTGVRKAVVGGAAVGVLAVVGLLFKSDIGLPFIPGRPSTTASPDPVGYPPGGPTADAAALYFRVSLSDLDLDGDDVSAPVGPQDSTHAADLRAPAETSVRNPLAYFDTEADSLDRIAELDRDGGEVRSLDGSTRDIEEVLVSVLLVLIMLKASRDQDRDRRSCVEAPVSAGELQTSAPTYA